MKVKYILYLQIFSEILMMTEHLSKTARKLINMMKMFIKDNENEHDINELSELKKLLKMMKTNCGN